MSGHPLRSDDLDRLVAQEARLLGGHVRAVHGTAGVADGLCLSLDASGRRVTVSAGAAFTRCGEAIALHRAVTIEGPRRPILSAPRARFVLALGPAPREERGPCERLPVRCLEAAADRTPVLRWVPVAPSAAAEMLGRDDISLGAFMRRQDGTLEAPDFTDRIAARPLARPHIRGGAVKLADLSWDRGAFPLRTYVDTRVAGFASTPAYLASLAMTVPLPAGYIGPFVGVEYPSAGGFTVRLVLAHQPPQPASAMLDAVMPYLAGAALQWSGLESTRGCP